MAIKMLTDGVGAPPPKSSSIVFPYGLRLENVCAKTPREILRQQMGWEGSFIIGTAARLDPVKRLERLIKAISLLPNKQHFRVAIVGDGDPCYREQLVDFAKSLGVDQYIEFLGYRSDVLDLVNAMDFFVLPSCGEAFGLALIEALALGVPCAAYADGGGPTDIVGENGLIVSSDSELASLIERIDGDPEYAIRLKHNAIERSKAFDISLTANNMMRVYQEALSSAPNS